MPIGPARRALFTLGRVHGKLTHVSGKYELSS
jgi:hypothetical protein